MKYVPWPLALLIPWLLPEVDTETLRLLDLPSYHLARMCASEGLEFRLIHSFDQQPCLCSSSMPDSVLRVDNDDEGRWSLPSWSSQSDGGGRVNP